MRLRCDGQAGGASTMATYEAVMEELRAAGTAQNVKIYRRHGARGDLFGVSSAHLNALKKRLKTDHHLARALWASGNYDARILATMVADPQQMTARRPRRLGGGGGLLPRGGRPGPEPRGAPLPTPLGDGQALDRLGRRVGRLRRLAAAVGPGPARRERRRRCLPRPAAGHRGAHPRQPEPRPPRDEQRRDRHREPNPALAEAATATARRIGPVEVDHGETDCKTPDAGAYIERVWARKASKGQAA